MQVPLDRLTNADGVLAAVLVRGETVESSVSSRSTLSKEKWQDIFGALATLMDKAKDLGEKDLRVVLGDYTMTVMRFEGVGVLGAAIPLGHPVAKSLRRMMTRSVKVTSTRVSKPVQPDAATL